MAYEAKNYDKLLGTEGFSDKLLQNNFKLYQGYVANTNKAAELLKSLEAGTPAWAEVKRRFGWEFNGMRLHELYFGNLKKGGAALNSNSKIVKKIAEQYGSIENWEKDFRTSGSMRGIGWVVLSYDKEADKLFNVWINEHDVGHLGGAVPLLVLDVFEHAFMPDYMMDRASYMNSFFKAVNWDEINKRLEKA